MGVYILISILYLGFLGMFYIGFKEFKSYKENIQIFQNLSEDRIETLRSLYERNIVRTKEFEEYVESYQESIKNDIKRIYEEDQVVESINDLMLEIEQFKVTQKEIQNYLTQTVYKLEKHPEKKHLELKRILNVNKSQIENIQKELSTLKRSTLDFQNYTIKEISSLRSIFSKK